MKNLFLILLTTILFCSCSTQEIEQRKVRKEIAAAIPSGAYKIDNDCQIVASTVYNAIGNYNTLQGCKWKQVILIEYYDPNDPKKKKLGHAMVVFLFPPGSNKLWVADELGTRQIHAYINDAYQVGRVSMAAKYPYMAVVTKAYYITESEETIPSEELKKSEDFQKALQEVLDSNK